MRFARITVGVGALLFVGVFTRAGALVLGYIDNTGTSDIVAAVVALLLVTNGASYLQGRADRTVDRGIHRRRLMLRAADLAPASVSPAAGRQDASLPPAPGSSADTHVLPRVAAHGFPVHVPAVPPLPDLRLCLSGPAAEARLSERGSMGCFWCSHAAPPHSSAGWQRGMADFAVCPCCIGRYHR